MTAAASSSLSPSPHRSNTGKKRIVPAEDSMDRAVRVLAAKDREDATARNERAFICSKNPVLSMSCTAKQ